MMFREDDECGTRDEVLFVAAPDSYNPYWIPAENAQTKTLARALLELLAALLGFGFRVFVRILTIAFIVVVYAAIFFAALLAFGILFAAL